MTRVKRGNVARQRRKKVLKRAKGFFGAAKLLYRIAKPAVVRAMVNATKDRRVRKRDFRSLWTMRINAKVREAGISYSRFINMLSKANVKLNRKSLAQLAVFDQNTFMAIVNKVKG